jgi:DNA-binding CsgD family transcriptional regulator
VKNALSPQRRIALIKQELRKTSSSGIPMGLKLFLLLIVLVLTIVIGAFALMLATGTFTTGLTQSKVIVESELLHASQEVSAHYGQISQQAVEFSRAVSGAVEKELDSLGIPVSNLKQHPEILESIISGQFDRALFTLQISKSSGVFLILDATVNPALDNAQNSRAGLYIKNMEPNIISSSTPTIIVFRGFPSIGRRNYLSLHAQWQMEFDTSDAPYYHVPMAAAASNPGFQLSRLYYWCPAFPLKGTSEEVMLCSVPLIASDGSIFGVCGLEISDMLFKLSHMPERGIYSRLFCALSPINGNTLLLSKSLFAGGYSAKTVLRNNGILEITDNNMPFYSYAQNGNNLFLGLHTPINLYPEGSAFMNEKWAAAIMVPQEDIVGIISRLNLLLFSSLALLSIIGIIASFILSRRFLKPIARGLAILKSANLEEAPKTKVPEIDDLIEYLKTRNKKLYEKAREGNLSISLLDEFTENLKTLSPSERAVFDLYAKGHTSREAAEALFLSINTIKTHTKRIYMKLNVASREELLLYISMLKEIGKDI